MENLKKQLEDVTLEKNLLDQMYLESLQVNFMLRKENMKLMQKLNEFQNEFENNKVKEDKKDYETGVVLN